MSENRKTYKAIAVSCKAKDLLDEIVRVAAINRGAFVEKLIEREHERIVVKGEK